MELNEASEVITHKDQTPEVNTPFLGYVQLAQKLGKFFINLDNIKLSV